MPNAKEYLATYNFTMDQARSFILGNYVSNLELIYNTCAKYGVNNSMIAEILAGDFKNLSGDIVSSFFDNNGYKGVDLGLSTITGTSGNDVLNGTSSNDIMLGYDGNDTFYSGLGSDTLKGGIGNDTFSVNGIGTKNILEINESNNNDILDLSSSPEKSGAVLDLVTGGTVGTSTTVILGEENSDSSLIGSLENNVMIILDSSGSMAGTRIKQAKEAAIDLLNAYDKAGKTSVRLVDFDSTATSSFNKVDGWMSVSDAKNVLNTYFDAYGSTSYVSAINKAITAFSLNKGSAYLENAPDTIFFLSDGEPTSSIGSTQQTTWENFLIDNKATAYSIGFGELTSSDIAYLEPIAFDSTKIVDSNGDGMINSSDNHAPGQIAPSFATDSSTLSEILVSTAKIQNGLIEGLIGTKFDDKLKGNSLDNTINGGSGNDTISGFDGNDTLIGGDGDDTLTGSSGEDTLSGGVGKDKFVFNGYSEGKDFIQDFVSGTDKILIAGQSFDDSIYPNSEIIVEASYEAYPTGISNTNPVKGLFVKINFTGTKADGTIAQFNSGFLRTDDTSLDPNNIYADTYQGLKSLIDSRLDAQGFTNLSVELGSTIKSITTGAGAKTVPGSTYQIKITDPNANAFTNVSSGAGQEGSGQSIDVVSNIYAHNPLNTLKLASQFTYNSTKATKSDYEFSYNSTTGELSFDPDGSYSGSGFTVIATLIGAPTLLASDIEVI